jgi:hypothetical protein
MNSQLVPESVWLKRLKIKVRICIFPGGFWTEANYLFPPSHLGRGALAIGGSFIE